MKNSQVVKAFAAGRPAAGGNLRTDGKNLWSYQLKIAALTPKGKVVVGDFTAPGGDFHSVTTSRHVSLTKTVADLVMLPELFSELFSRTR
jgi:hypothetical protein